MSTSRFQESLIDYIQSGHALLSVLTPEKDRARQEIIQVANSLERAFFDWSVVSGWKDRNGHVQFTSMGMDPGAQNATCDPFIALTKVRELPPNSILVMRDFGFYMNQTTFPTFDQIIAALDELRPSLSTASESKTILFVGPEFQAPTILRHAITDVVFDMPGDGDIESLVRYVCEGTETADGKAYKPDEKQLPGIVQACKGMTQLQVIDRVALALRRCKKLDVSAVHDILREKASVIRASGLLTYRDPPPGGLTAVGGLEGVKRHVDLDRPCFSKEAAAFGLAPPKGILLVGIPGCGKTLCSLSIASEYGFPLIGMDVGDLMSKFVGESESNMSEAIRILEAIAPVVLQLDEIEKGFGGGDLDGGASQRVFGKFIKWLNDRKAPVYVVATANDVTRLPPEFARKGRFDEIFGIDLPTPVEREQIVRIHLTRRKRDVAKVVPNKTAMDTIVGMTDGFTGADIEAAVILAMKLAFRNSEDINMTNLGEAVSQVVPLSKTEPSRLEKIREWCKRHAKPATITLDRKPVTDPRGSTRKVVTKL